MKSTLLFLLFTFGIIYPQSDTTFSLDVLTVNLSGNILHVLNPANKELFQKKLNNASAYSTDLDGDGTDELIVSDYLEKSGKKDYILYVYSTVDSFSESAAIYSGYLEPYVTFSDEVQKDIIVSGDSSLNYLNTGSDIFYPITCWELENGEVIVVNDDLYDIFISENDTIIDYLDNYYNVNAKNCDSGKKVRNAIAAGYINYISAGEISMASHLLENYYLCNDSLTFKQELDKIINKDQ